MKKAWKKKEKKISHLLNNETRILLQLSAELAGAMALQWSFENLTERVNYRSFYLKPR